MIEHIQKALEVVTNKEDINLDVIDNYLALFNKYRKSTMSFLTGNSSDSYIFIQLKPVKFDAKKLYTSNITTDNAYELSVVPAKRNEEGEWVPDDSRNIVKGLLSHRVIMESMFDSHYSAYHPMSITELDSVPVEFAESELSNKDSYGSSFRKRENTINTHFESLSNFAHKAQEEGLSFSKKNTENFLSSLGILRSNVSSDFDYNLKRDASQLERDFYELKKEVQDSMTAGIVRAGEHLSLPDLTQQPSSRISDFFDFNSAGEGYEDVAKLLIRYADTLTSYSDNELKKEIYRYANNFTNKHIIEEANRARLGKGAICFNRPSGVEIGLFGENRSFQNFYCLDISFGSEIQSNDGKVKVNEFVNFLQIWLSPYQAMELVQCSLTGGWVKGTLKRYCNHGVASPMPGDDDHSTVKINGEYSSPYVSNIQKLIEEAVDIVTNQTATKGRRARLVEIIDEMKPLLHKEESNRRESFELKQERLYNDYAANSKKELSRIISNIEESHPQIFQKFKELKLK